MDVAFSTDSSRVSELFRHSLNGAHDVSFGLRFCVELSNFMERKGGENRTGPGPKILSREIRLGDLAEVLVHVARVDGSLLTIVVDVLEELLTGQILAVLHDPGEFFVLQIEGEPDAALSAKRKMDFFPLNLDVLVAHGCEAERAILLRVFFIADADQRGLEKFYDRGNDFFARQPRQREMLLHLGANRRQFAAECNHSIVFRLVAYFAPARMIPVLLSPFAVAARRLQVTVGNGTDPHACPRRRNRQRFDPLQMLGIAQRLSFGIDVMKPCAGTFARDSR